MLFDEELVYQIVEFTNLMAKRRKPTVHRNYRMKNLDCFWQFCFWLAIISSLNKGYIGNQKSDTFVQAVEKQFRMDFTISPHVWQWKDDKFDKICKVRPVIDHLHEKIVEYIFNGKDKFIENSMVPYFGMHGSRQRVNKKPIYVG